MRKIIFICVISLFLIQGSCSSHRQVERTETVTQSGDSQQTQTKVIGSEKTSSDSSDNYCSGLLSCTVTVVGDIIAAPFRLVGGLIDVLF